MTNIQVQQEKELILKLMSRSPLGVVLIDEEGLITGINELAKGFLAVAGEIGSLLLPSADWPRFQELLVEEKEFYYLIGDNGYVIVPQTFELGERLTLIRMIPGSSMEVDLISMQQDLIQQRKLANLGRMILEMAHELNNPLTGISMGTQLIGLSLKKIRKHLAEDTPDPAAIQDIIGKIEHELERINQSTGRASALRHEVLAYSKPNQLNLRPYQTNKLLQATLNNFKSQPVFKRLKIHTEFSENSPTILCDASKLEQILYNLLNNAHEASQGRGEVWIREYITPGNVLIEVEDNGPGIPEDMVDKIFSPFLTTKPRTGTGLGLSISQQIIHQHGGTFSVYNKPQSGACFQITFPVYQEIPTYTGQKDDRRQ